MRFRQRSHSSISVMRLVFAVIVSAAIGFGFLAPAATAQTNAGTESIAHGVSNIPSDDSGESAWRVVLDTAQPASDTQPVERALGFVMAIDDPILVSHADTGTIDLVPADGASFVNEGDFEQRSSLDSEPSSYYRIALVPPEQAGDQANGEVILSGDAFATPDGPRAINLQSTTIASGNEATVAAGSAPSMVIVTSGSVTLGDGSTLGEGDSATVSGDVSLAANETDAVAAVATIGDDIPLPDGSGEASEIESDDAAATPVTDDAESDATEESSVSILVEAIDCSNGDPATWENCTPLEGILFSLARAEATSSSETGITTDQNGQVYDSAVAGVTVTVGYTSGAPDTLVPLTGAFTAEDVQEGQVFVFVFGTADQAADASVGDTAPESSVKILVEAFDCSNGDPVSGDNCAPIEGVVFSLARAEETSSSETGVTTDANGQVYESSLAGTTVTVTYSSGAPGGLVPLTGPFTAEDVQEGQTYSFIFGTPEQQGQ